ncbi:MAG: hypothetical protein ACE5OZ_12730 [Candidatus Heimdallarchaeota archaeon]
MTPESPEVEKVTKNVKLTLTAWKTLKKAVADIQDESEIRVDYSAAIERMYDAYKQFRSLKASNTTS